MGTQHSGTFRHVVELQALKGLSYCPQWRLSLDFVPHITGGGKVRWHRTAKSARLDLVYRPIDFEPSSADTREWAVSRPVSFDACWRMLGAGRSGLR